MTARPGPSRLRRALVVKELQNGSWCVILRNWRPTASDRADRRSKGSETVGAFSFAGAVADALARAGSNGLPVVIEPFGAPMRWATPAELRLRYQQAPSRRLTLDEILGPPTGGHAA